MRKQFVTTLEDILLNNSSAVLFLGDIGVYGFKNLFQEIPERIYNIGILEQTTIGLSAGLSMTGLIPFVYTIAPFIVERALEQLKIDFGYQELNGNFISIGASYDYSSLGATHHCPADIQLISSIPNFEIVIPGTSYELNILINQCYNNGHPTYFRLSEYENDIQVDIKFGRGNLIKQGNDATILCFGNMLDKVIKATENLNVNVLYYSTILPFDSNLLIENFNENIIIIEQFYEGSVNHIISPILKNKKCRISNISVPRRFITNYSNKDKIDEILGLDVQSLKTKISTICYDR